ncbi:Arm DNA-binding domain-containing protein [Rhodovarius sp.]|uniref:Arm DNA-binding domain-containing protein n=1 Tax=Rhodovarius sp. TaxID=2972673 RepID=UPI00333FC8EE
MRVAITEVVIADLKRDLSPKTLDIWDNTVRGLVLRILPSGRMTWSVRAWTSSGSRTSIKLGEHPALRAVDARRQALIQLGAVQQGRDPVRERRAEREIRRTAAAAITVEKALTDWQTSRSTSAENPWSATYISRVASALRVHIPARLQRHPLADTRRETWTKLLAGVARDRPGAGAFLYTIVSSFLGYAEAMG